MREGSQPGSQNSLIVWGQSIGAGVAVTAAATHLSNLPADLNGSRDGGIAGLVLETPFVSIRSMLATLYPQRWLPYRYLWPFLWNWWDSEAALRAIAATQTQSRVLLVQAEKDEIVPEDQMDRLEGLCRDLELKYSRKTVRGAFHTEVLTKRQGREVIARFLGHSH